MPATRFCFCLSIKTGANTIGILMILLFIFVSFTMAGHSHIYAWFVAPAFCYGLSAGFYVRYLIQDSYATRRDFFVFYIVFIAFITRIYEYVFFKNKPEYIEEICDQRANRL